MSGEQMVFAFDGSCRLCRRVVGMLRAVVSARQVEFVDAFDTAALRQRGIHKDLATLLRDVHLFDKDRTHIGVDAYRASARRSRWLRPFYLALTLPGGRWTARLVYRRIADRRRCALPDPGAGREKPLTSPADENSPT